MDGSLVVAFWGVSILFVLTPGVDWAYAISSGLTRRGVFPSVTGMLTGHLTATLAVAAGVAALVAASDLVMTLLTLAGALYLVSLGTATLRHPAAADLAGETAPTTSRRQFLKGIGISLLNPKVFLLILALLPQFTSREAGLPVGIQMIVIGALQVLNCAIVYFVVAYGARTMLTTRPRAAQVVSLLSGIVMIGLGLVLAAEEVVTLNR